MRPQTTHCAGLQSFGGGTSAPCTDLDLHCVAIGWRVALLVRLKVRVNRSTSTKSDMRLLGDMLPSVDQQVAIYCMSQEWTYNVFLMEACRPRTFCWLSQKNVLTGLNFSPWKRGWVTDFDSGSLGVLHKVSSQNKWWMKLYSSFFLGRNCFQRGGGNVYPFFVPGG